MGLPRIQNGTYPLSVEDDRIKFRIGKKEYSIYTDYLMNHGGAPVSCLKEISKRNRIYPLKPYPSNRFTLGHYAEIEIFIHFNHVEIKSTQT
jgi:hypothetical protein